jgi:hypothetical protein
LLTSLAWELPNYGPGPDFGRGTIYDPDYEDEAPGKRLNSNEEHVAEVVDYAPKEARHHYLPPTPAGPAPGRSNSILEPRRPHIQGTGDLNTYEHVQSSHPSVRKLQSGPNPRRKRNHAGSIAARPYSQPNRGTPAFSQHGTQSSIVTTGQNDTPSKAKWRKGSRPDGKCTTHNSLNSITDAVLAAFRLPCECRVIQKK